MVTDDDDLAIPRTVTPEHTPSVLVTVRTEHILYFVAETDNDDAFYVWAKSSEAVVDVIAQRAQGKNQQFAFRGIKVLT